MKLKINLLALVFYSLTAVCHFSAFADDGTNSSGGAGDLASSFQTIRTLLNELIVKDSSILSPEIKRQLLSQSDVRFKFDSSAQSSDGSGEGIVLEKTPSTDVLLVPSVLQKQYGALLPSKVLSVVIAAYSMRFESSVTAKMVVEQLNRLIRNQYPVREFLDFDQISLQSDLKSIGCRDSLHLTSDSVAGVIDLQADSSSSCISSDWPEAQNSAANKRIIDHPRNKYLCSSLPGGDIQCVALTMSSDLYRCAMNLSAQDLRWPRLLIHEDHSVDVNYFWCDVSKDQHYTHEQKIHYAPVKDQ